MLNRLGEPANYMVYEHNDKNVETSLVGISTFNNLPELTEMNSIGKEQSDNKCDSEQWKAESDQQSGSCYGDSNMQFSQISPISLAPKESKHSSIHRDTEANTLQ